MCTRKNLPLICFVLLVGLAGDVSATTWANLGAFAEQWLAEGCSADNWCEGADIDHSGKVNFVDFAVFAQPGTVYYVKNPAEITAAMNSAKPGDTLIMANGVWTDDHIEFEGEGTKVQPIKLRAETPGQVILSGQSSLWLGGGYLVVDGLTFTNGYLNNSSGAIRFQSSANHCRVTNCAIINYSRPDTTTKHKWVILNGSNNRVDHCYFSGKTDKDVMVKVKVDSTPDNHQIDHNYFGDRPRPPEGGNGFEIFRVGSGSVSTFESRTTVEHNYFYNCSGEGEIISNKSRYNIYRYNTFVECEGDLVLRQGKGVLVAGNFFFGNGKDKTGGVRITAEDHTIINNYFVDLAGGGGRAAMVLESGIPGLTDGGHAQTRNVLIAFNSFVNCRENIRIGNFHEADIPNGIVPPDNCTIANNIVKGSIAPLITQIEDFGPPTNFTWQGNIMHGAELGIEPNAGITMVDPKLEQGADGLYRPADDSPAIDAAVGDYPDVVTDMDGQRRDDGAKDIGADEVSMDSVRIGPLSPEDVGPSWW